MRGVWLALGLAASTACGGGDGAHDSGVSPDAGDAAVPDASVPDAYVADGGSTATDAGPPTPPCAAEDVAGWDLATGTWSTEFLPPGLSRAGDRGPVVYAARWHGRRLHVAGAFTHAGPIPASNVAVWSPVEGWSALGEGLPDPAYDIAVASGGTIYATTTPGGGYDSSQVHAWSGAEWTLIGTSNLRIDALAVDSEGGLLAGGHFTAMNGVAAYRLARFDGSSWIGETSPGGPVEALFVDDGGTCVGGRSGGFGGYVACRETAGGTWTLYPLPPQPGPPYPSPVHSILRDTSDRVVAAGAVVLDGDRDTGGVVAWEGTEWALLEPGLGVSSGAPEVWSATLGPDRFIWAVGDFDSIGTTLGSDLALGVARYSGGRWYGGGALQGGDTIPRAFAIVAGESDLYAAGSFTEAINPRLGGTAARAVARWDGTRWLALPHRGSIGGGPGPVRALAARGRCGPYVAGAFQFVEDEVVSHVGRLDGLDDLQPVGADAWLGSYYGPHTVAVAPDGTVYAAATDLRIEGRRAVLARLRGPAWEAFGPFDDPYSNQVRTLAVDDDGTLYVGGVFVAADGTREVLMTWADGVWSAASGASVDAVAALYVGNDGVYTAGSAEDGAYVSRWDGTAWSPLGDPLDGTIHALVEDGSGLVAGGTGLLGASEVARWTGEAWVSVEPLQGPDGVVYDLAVAGDALVAVGSFQVAEDGPGNAAYLDGSEWRPVGGGLDDTVRSVLVTERGLLFGGFFELAGDVPAWGLARFEPASGP